MTELEHISELSTLDSGGGMVLDLLKLKDGRLLVISEDAIVLYKSVEAFENGEGDESQTIYL